LAKVLLEGGVYMGRDLNGVQDKEPMTAIFDAAREMGRYVRLVGDNEWAFDKVRATEPTGVFCALIRNYIDDLAEAVSRGQPYVGWKLPETILCYPWLLRLFPRAWYIHLVRDPLDVACSSPHLTDDLTRFGVPGARHAVRREGAVEEHAEYKERCISWKYQMDILERNPRPRRYRLIRFEDLVLRYRDTVRQLGEFLGLDFGNVNVPVYADRVMKWQKRGVPQFAFIAPYRRRYGYVGNESVGGGAESVST
jgi:hypothetical protein